MKPNHRNRARSVAPVPDQWPAAAPHTAWRDDDARDFEPAFDEDDRQQSMPVRLPQRAYDRTMSSGSDDD